MAADTDAGEPAHDGGEQTDEQPDGERFVVAKSTIESTESTLTDAFDVSTYYQRGREQRHWVVDRAGPDPTGYSLGVCEDGVVTAIRTVPYDGQRRYSTEDRPNRSDKSSQFRLSVDEVLAEYIERGEPEVSVDELRRRVLAVLRDDRVAANNNEGRPRG